MPELPEAETIVRELRGPVIGRRIARVEVLHPDLLDVPQADFRSSLEGLRVERVRRRGKNVVVCLEGGARLVVNLGMSGRLLHRVPGEASPPPTHPAIRLALADPPEDPGTLVYHDPRRFGRLRVLGAGAYRRWSDTLGPEPLSRAFTARRLGGALSRSVSPLRSWLLDQRRVAGIGNIYANEACHVAGIHPATPASGVPAARIPALHRALRKVLRDAILQRGTTLRDYRSADGSEGSYAVSLRVYGREGAACPRCRTPVERIVFSNRSAFFCPRCQPEPDS